MHFSKLALFFSTALMAASTAASAGSRLAYMQEVDSQKRVILANADGSEPTTLPSAGGWALYPDVSSDGRYIAYSSGADGSHLGIFIYDSERKVTEQWTDQTGLFLHADLNADGRFLAFSGPVGANGKQQIGIIDLQKERAKGPATRTGSLEVYRPTLKVVEHAAAIYFPNLSSDGEYLVFQTSQGATKSIVQRELASGKDKVLTAEDGYAMSPALSFDDRYIAYTLKGADEVWELYLQDLQNGSVQQLTKTAFKDFSPAFTADGGLIYAANPDGPFQLFSISAEEIRKRTFAVKALPLQNGDLYSPSVSGELSYSQATLPSIPEPGRSSFGAIAHAGKIFVVGGHVGPEHTYPPESFSDRVEIYDQATKTWKQGASLSLARHGFGLAAYNGYIYAFGGFTYSPDHKPKWKSVDLVERYSIAENRWEVVAHLAKPRSSNVVAMAGTKVYLIGGWDSTPQHDNDLEGRFHDTIEVFDLATETAAVLDLKLVNPLRRALSGVVRGDEVILVGGLGVGASHFELLDTVTALNTKTLTWHEYPKLPFATFAPAAGLIGDSVFVFGGMFKTGAMNYNYVNHIYNIDLVKDTAWSHSGRHITETKGFGQVVEMSPLSLGILGGHSYRDDQDAPVATFETWTRR